MRHLELFSGIGGFRRAMELLELDHIGKFQSCGFSEIDSKALATYRTNYAISSSEVNMGDIVSYTIKNEGFKTRMNQLGTVDLLTGGFPCQTFSMMGKQAGFDDEERGQMFFRILDIIDSKSPKYLLLENVKNLLTHDSKRTLKRILSELENRGYRVFPNLFNTLDFGLPQTRNRVLIFATREPISRDFAHIYTPENVKKYFWEQVSESSVKTYKSTLEILSKKVDSKYLLSEKIKPTILADGSANFKSRSHINLKIARPLTASMHKMHRACQDNYFSIDFIESDGKINPDETLSKEELAKCAIRKLTPEEAFMLQGFPPHYATEARAQGVSNGALYKQAGNAVSVNTIYAVLLFLINHKAIL